MRTFIKSQQEGVSKEHEYEEEVQEVLSTPPAWIIRRGIAIIFVIFCALLAISYFVKYPDVIQSEIIITSVQVSADLKARASGRINLYAGDRQNVKKGSVIASIENPARYEDIVALGRYIDSSATKIRERQFNELKYPEHLMLGKIEPAYLQYLMALDEFRLFQKLHVFQTTIQDISLQLAIYDKMDAQLSKQMSIALRELQIAKNKVASDSILLSQKVIAPLDFERTMAEYLPFEKSIQQINSTILSNNLRRSELKSRMNEETMEYSETIDRLTNGITATFNTLLSELRIWQEQYLIVAPIDGQVSYFKFWSNTQNVSEGETILTVVPDQANIFAYMHIPMIGSGKAQNGQKVLIRLDSYPYQEYGIVSGVVKGISIVPQNNIYAVSVMLPNGLKTSHGGVLPFREQMKGNAQIITDDHRLISRFFYQINKIINSR